MIFNSKGVASLSNFSPIYASGGPLQLFDVDINFTQMQLISSPDQLNVNYTTLIGLSREQVNELLSAKGISYKITLELSYDKESK